MSAPISPYKAQPLSLLDKMNSISIVKNKLAICLVIIPTAISIIYFSVIASDIFISESRFIIRSASKDSMSNLGSGFGGVIGKMGLNHSENNFHVAEKISIALR
jgi:hypothetical protein